MSDELTANDDATQTGPMALVTAEPAPVEELVLTEPVEPDPDVPLVPSAQTLAAAPPVPEVQPAPVETPRAALVADAKTRSYRTLLQGLVTAVLGSVGLVVATFLHNGDATSVDWKALGMAVLVAAGTSAASFLHRMLGSTE